RKTSGSRTTRPPTRCSATSTASRTNCLREGYPDALDHSRRVLPVYDGPRLVAAGEATAMEGRGGQGQDHAREADVDVGLWRPDEAGRGDAPGPVGQGPGDPGPGRQTRRAGDDGPGRHLAGSERCRLCRAEEEARPAPRSGPAFRVAHSLRAG